MYAKHCQRKIKKKRFTYFSINLNGTRVANMVFILIPCPGMSK